MRYWKKMRSIKTNPLPRKGFTLIELLVVLAVLLFLLACGIVVIVLIVRQFM